MKLSIISFTKNGIRLSQKLVNSFRDTEFKITLYSKCSHYTDFGEAGGMSKGSDMFGENPIPVMVTKSLSDWTKCQMQKKNALLFIGACGIAVRAIAPSIMDKLQDSPVLVMDEKGEHIIPILSGHMGGANELAYLIAKKTGVEPVITTATDLNETFAVDLFAKKNHLHIVNKEGIAKVSSKALAGEEIVMSVESGHIAEDAKVPEGIRLIEYPPSEQVDILIHSSEIEAEANIILRPKEYVIGMGCRRGKEADKIEKFISKRLETAGILTTQIYALASIEQKKDEESLLAWSRKERVPFWAYTAKELEEVSGTFCGSDFVKKIVGVDNVCERAALKACENNGRLIREKYASDGMTIAIAKREWSVTFDYKGAYEEWK